VHDLLIVGAGPVGAMTALALHVKQSPHTVMLLDGAAAGEAAFQRTLALSYGSRLLLETIDVWSTITPTPQPIETIDVTQRDGAGHALIRAIECAVPALGYTMTYAALKSALDDALARAGVKIRYRAKVERVSVDPTAATARLADGESLDAAMLVMADGGSLALPGMRSFTRDHGQSAVVAQLRATRPLPTTAYERFTPQGPIAMLPLDSQGTYGLVWTHPRNMAAEVCDWDAARFIAGVQAAFGETLGALSLLNTPRHYPLGLKFTEPRALPRLIAIGNAAQSMHPIAGQGLNLGLRDAWQLAEHLEQTPVTQFGKLLPNLAYGLKRARDRTLGVAMTESLVSAFGFDALPIRAARGLGLGLLDAALPLKRALAKRMMFGSD
jgi:2-octaprenyl-6-methoxyphenol hydroxylase